MSAISTPAYGKHERTEEYVVAVRRDAHGKTYVPNGSLYCASCGMSSISKGDFARYAGVKLYDLTKWLNKGPVREDVAKRIRSKLLRIEEGDRA